MKPNIHRETARGYAALLQKVEWLQFRDSTIAERECCRNCHKDITEYADRIWMLVNSFDPEKARLLHKLVSAVCDEADLKDGRLIAALRVINGLEFPKLRVAIS